MSVDLVTGTALARRSLKLTSWTARWKGAVLGHLVRVTGPVLCGKVKVYLVRGPGIRSVTRSGYPFPQGSLVVMPERLDWFVQFLTKAIEEQWDRVGFDYRGPERQPGLHVQLIADWVLPTLLRRLQETMDRDRPWQAPYLQGPYR